MQTGGFNWRGGEGSITDRVAEDMPDTEENTLRWSAYTRPSTGLVYMQNRYYEPETGRFTQADPVAYGFETFLSGQNSRWTYCANDPVNWTDASGLIGLLGILVAIVIIVAIILLLVQAVTWMINLWKLCQTPRRCFDADNADYPNNDDMAPFLDDVGALANAPGCSHTGPPNPAADTPSAITQLINWFWGLF